MKFRRLFQGAALVGIVAIASNARAGSMNQLVEIESWLAPGNVAQMQYAPGAGLLFIRNAGSVVRVIDTTTHLQRSVELANDVFSDFDLTPDGRYLYAADFGGEQIGYGTPVSPSYVHRYDLTAGVWESRQVPGVAYRLEAVDDDRWVVLSSDQWVTLLLQQWGTTVTTLSTNSWTVYVGNIEYDPATGRVIHGNSGSSANDITAFQIAGSALVKAEGTGTYGSAQGYGGSMVLSTDGLDFYYGRLQVDAQNVRANRLVFPEVIYAASADLAFGKNGYYDALTGTQLGSLGFSATTYALDAGGNELWAYDSASMLLHHYAIVPEPMTAGLVLIGACMVLGTTARRARRPR